MYHARHADHHDRPACTKIAPHGKILMITDDMDLVGCYHCWRVVRLRPAFYRPMKRRARGAA